MRACPFTSTAGVCVLAAALPALADDDAAAARTQAALDKPAKLEFVETPLVDACQFIGKQNGVTIVLKDDVLRGAKLDPKTPITTSLNDISLRSALKLILHELRLDFRVEAGEVVLVARPAKLEADEPLSEPQRKAKESLTQLLDTPVEVQFTKRPLKDCLAVLAASAKVPITVDARGLEARGLTIDAPVTARLDKKVPLRDALAKVLTPLGLCAVIRYEVIVVTPCSKTSL